MFFSPYYFRPQPDVGEICYPDGTCITVGQGAGGTPPRPPVKPRPPIQIDPPIHQAPGGFPIPSGMPGGWVALHGLEELLAKGRMGIYQWIHLFL
ncbi:hypothetical protein D9C12_23070 (plasmid) [Bacillus subtilis subsp. subtilis]|nr:hypothetical protein D9C12_23070 [Bacillus subtilis subsp. subtilis]